MKEKTHKKQVYRTYDVEKRELSVKLSATCRQLNLMEPNGAGN